MHADDSGAAAPTPAQKPARKGGPHDRRTLLRDTAILQVKLVVDGLRDLVLVPASLVAAALSLADSRDGRPGPQFYDLLAMGRRSERFIDLFGALRGRAPDAADEDARLDDIVDSVVDRMEAYVVEEYRRGGVTKQAKERLDRALEALQKRRR